MAKIAVFSLTMNRLDYTKRMLLTLKKTAQGLYDHYIVDNGSTDGTVEFLTGNPAFKDVVFNKENLGISRASNQALNSIMAHGKYKYIIKVDNDCEFIDPDWLKVLLKVAKVRNMILSPFVEGLRENKGGAPRTSTSTIAGHPVGLTRTLGGICTLAPAHLFKTFRFTEQGKPYIWGAIKELIDKSGLPCGYVEDVKVKHMDTTSGQEAKYQDYFRKRNRERVAFPPL